ncbi:TRAF-type zinc finger [Mactra antiquata]
MAETESETQLCGNCKKQISSNNFVMHEMHCKRHISLCKHCKEPIPKNEMDVHYEENHAMMKCPKCKVEIEKMHFEDHEENDCSKKPMHCLYCELEFAKDELQAHIDYCGSRTEPCTKCGQFIMLKEQIKHDESNCTYPEVKPKNNNVVDGNTRRNPFEFDDFSRMMGGHDIFTDFGAASQMPFNEPYTPPQRPQARVTRQTVKSTNSTKKTNVNKTNGGSSSNASTSGTDIDRLLAMHLAQDLGHSDDSIDDIVRNLDKPIPSSPTLPNQYGRNAFPGDGVMLPCEFCNQQVDVDDLEQHQSGCSLDRISSMLPHMGKNNPPHVPNNYSPVGDISPVSPPTIIDNLRPFRADEWLDDTAVPRGGGGYDSPVEHEDLMLPCEFCDVLLPIDSLVQHQAMCDRMTMTPLPPTPPEERRIKPATRSSNTTATRLVNEFPNLSTRNQPPNRLYDLRDDSDDDFGARVAHTVQKPKPKSSTRNGMVKNDVTSPGREIRSTLRKYGVESVDRGDDYTRQSSNLSRQNSGDSWQLPSSNQASKRSGSYRARSTLDDLLRDTDNKSSHDLLGHIGASGSRKPETNIGVRQKVSVQPSVVRGPTKTKPTTTNAKGVHRELSRASNGNTNGLPPRNRTTNPGFQVRVRPSEADETSDIVTGQRRSRANNVFGASTVKSNSNNRRPSNR